MAPGGGTSRLDVSAHSRCGGGGGDQGGGICGDLARRGDRGNPRLHVGRYDVPVAAAPLGDDRYRRRVAVSAAVRRMRRLPGTDPAGSRRSVESQISKSWECWHEQHGKCPWLECDCWCHVLVRSLDDPHLASERAPSRVIRPIASSARARARAWVFSTRHGLVRNSSSLEVPPPRGAETNRTATSCRAGKTQSRAARLAKADGGNPGRTRGLRRASEAVVHAR